MGRRWFWVTAVAALVFLGLMVGTRVAQAQGIQIIQNAYSSTFNKELIFELALQSQAGIPEGGITLFYSIGDSDVVNRRPAEFQPGKTVTARAIDDVDQGEIPPMSEIHYYWEIKDEAGDTFKTDPVSFLYVDDRFKWQSGTEGPVTVYWYDGVDGERLLRVATQALRRLEGTIGYQMQMPIKIVTYKGKRDMDAATRPRGSLFDEQVITLGTVVAPDIMLLQGTHADVDNTIAHELTHMVVEAATENPFAGIPAWLDEGLAMYNQNTIESVYAQVLRDAVRRHDLDTVRRLSGRTGAVGRVNLWYAEVWNLIDFLIREYGEDKMAELLEVFSRGAHPDDALMKVYGFDQDGLTQRWWESLGVEPPPELQPKATQPASPGAPQARKLPTGAPTEAPAGRAGPEGVETAQPAESSRGGPPLTTICCLGLLPLGLLIFGGLRLRKR